MNCVNYNCDELPEHIAGGDCEDTLGGISSMIVFNCDHGIVDYGDGVQIQAALDAGEARLVEGVQIGVDAASPIEGPSYVSCQPQKTINYDRTFTIKDANVKGVNNTFYNELFKGRAFGGAMLHLCDADCVLVIDDAISFQGSVIIPEDNNDSVRAEGNAKWKSKTGGEFFQTPAGIF